MERIAVEQVRNLVRVAKRINDLPLNEIEWTENGEVIDIDPITVSNFIFTGLNNIDFITSSYYKNKPEMCKNGCERQVFHHNTGLCWACLIIKRGE